MPLIYIMVAAEKKLTVEEFFNLPKGKTAYELIDGKAIAKSNFIVMPSYVHRSKIIGM